eukprot:TRINITY_DN10603_c0_g1_i4.p1 TRINITY_DN10603_c0_g1~~TRINITY_DN10603_c0_g1_i4.p1  ORF type:complete len:194 (-),score=23.88 TRINITY_DN10603_c0_g1_i4:18-599(-)
MADRAHVADCVRVERQALRQLMAVRAGHEHEHKAGLVQQAHIARARSRAKSAARARPVVSVHTLKSLEGDDGRRLFTPTPAVRRPQSARSSIAGVTKTWSSKRLAQENARETKMMQAAMARKGAEQHQQAQRVQLRRRHVQEQSRQRSLHREQARGLTRSFNGLHRPQSAKQATRASPKSAKPVLRGRVGVEL